MEVAIESMGYDMFNADLNKQISLLIMDDDEPPLIILQLLSRFLTHLDSISQAEELAMKKERKEAMKIIYQLILHTKKKKKMHFLLC